jgi:hypothetical protein
MRVVILIVTLGVVHFVLVDYIFDDYCLIFASGVIIRVLRALELSTLCCSKYIQHTAGLTEISIVPHTVHLMQALPMLTIFGSLFDRGGLMAARHVYGETDLITKT